MAESSRFLSLIEQTGSEFYDIDVVNSNLETVDSACSRSNICVNISNLSSLPHTYTSPVNGPMITSNHRVVGMVLSNSAAQQSDWSYTVTNGSITISGAINGTTNATLFLAEFYGNHTISQIIPADARKNDATGVKNLGSFSSIADLGNLMDSELVSMPTYTFRNFYAVAGADIGTYFSRTLTYYGTLYKGGTNNYPRAFLRPNSNHNLISMYRLTESTQWNVENLYRAAQNSFTQLAAGRFSFTTSNALITGSQFTLSTPSIVIATQTYNNAPPKNLSIHTVSSGQHAANCLAAATPGFDSSIIINAVLPARTYYLWGAAASAGGNDWTVKACAI